MALRFDNLLKYTVAGTDGNLGKLKDILFDDHTCRIRYLVVDTARWLPGKQVLLTPDSLEVIDQQEGKLRFNLTKEMISESPPLESDLPVSRQYEQRLHSYYGWTPYWTAPPTMATWFPYPDYGMPYGAQENYAQAYPRHWSDVYAKRQENFEEHLRSCDEVQGYKIASSDDKEFGEVADLIIDPERWLLIDLLLASHRWLPGGKYLVCSPLFVTNIDESNKLLHISLPKAALLESPNYNSETYGADFRRSLVEHYLRAMGESDVDVNRLRERTPTAQGF